MARARLTLARLDLMASLIRAPFAGEVAALHVEIGERVAAGQAALRLAARDTDRPTRPRFSHCTQQAQNRPVGKS